MTEDFGTAWLVYLGATGLALLVMVWLTWRLSRRVSWPVWAGVATWFLVPWTVSAESTDLGPAWIIGAFDLLLSEGDDPWRVLLPLGVLALALALVALVVAVLTTRKA